MQGCNTASLTDVRSTGLGAVQDTTAPEAACQRLQAWRPPLCPCRPQPFLAMYPFLEVCKASLGKAVGPSGSRQRSQPHAAHHSSSLGSVEPLSVTVGDHSAALLGLSKRSTARLS